MAAATCVCVRSKEDNEVIRRPPAFLPTDYRLPTCPATCLIARVSNSVSSLLASLPDLMSTYEIHSYLFAYLPVASRCLSSLSALLCLRSSSLIPSPSRALAVVPAQRLFNPDEELSFRYQTHRLLP